MKKIYLSFLGILISVGSFAQLTNLGLESWTAGSGYDDPDGWTTINQYAGLVGINPNVVKLSTNVSEGQYAAEMFTQNCAACVGFGAPDPAPGLLVQQTGYYTNTATDFTFDYQYEGVNGDWGAVMVELTIWDFVGDSARVIARAVDTIGATMTTWNSRTVSFVYDFPAQTPDTINIYFVSSARDVAQDPSFPAPQAGSTLRVDNIAVIDPAAGVDEIASDLNVFAYQNIITIQSSNLSKAPYQVVDITGKTVMTGSTDGKTTRINANTLQSGVYLISIGSGDHKLVKKVIIE